MDSYYYNIYVDPQSVDYENGIEERAVWIGTGFVDQGGLIHNKIRLNNNLQTPQKREHNTVKNVRKRRKNWHIAKSNLLQATFG